MRREPGSKVARRVVRAPYVIGVVGVLALLFSSCGGGTPHAVVKVHHAVAQHVRTSPATVSPPSTSTTTSAPAVKTSPNTFTPTPTTRPAPPPPTTTTTDPFPPGCAWSNFGTTVSTDQGTYSTGQTVHITLVFANHGPACTVNTTGYGCPAVAVENASTSTVWSNAGTGPVLGCPEETTAPTVLPPSWSQTFTYAWAQAYCTAAQGCPGPQVPTGQYQVLGGDGGGVSHIPGAAPVAITLTP